MLRGKGRLANCEGVDSIPVDEGNFQNCGNWNAATVHYDAVVVRVNVGDEIHAIQFFKHAQNVIVVGEHVVQFDYDLRDWLKQVIRGGEKGGVFRAFHIYFEKDRLTRSTVPLELVFERIEVGRERRGKTLFVKEEGRMFLGQLCNCVVIEMH